MPPYLPTPVDPMLKGRFYFSTKLGYNLPPNQSQIP